MKILALYPYIHLSSSALLIDGKIVAASPEERFDRQKMSTAFPNKSAAWCLKSQGLKWEDLDMIVVPWNPMRNVNHASRRWVNEMNWRGQLLSHVPIHVMRAINGPFENEMEIKWGKTRIVYMNHHECHAANGFFFHRSKRRIFSLLTGMAKTRPVFSVTVKEIPLRRKAM
ncbi:MAG: hypothetical protein FJY20_11415 [Bacteroidetes bacterium]|nr:hypothetical protein [Bacteroidota bacterium]